MTIKKRLFWILIFTIVTLPALHAQDGTEPDYRKWALTPPMGWNSWDCFSSTVTESEVMANAEYMRDHLKQYGWEYVVVDIRWYISNPKRYYNTTNQIYNIDAYGRYIPAVNRFPSSAGGQGFKVLADKIHAMGLKFGIHMMRGLPIQAAKQKLPVLGGGGITCDQICNNDSACSWLYDNYKVKYSAAGQLYYNSLFDLYASWGVDFVKIDDLSRPVHTGEIDMIHKAILQCGRPIVFSLSPGKTDINYGQFVADRGNQWRMMDDLWDNWNEVYAVFAEANRWTPFCKPGNYPDADMLPIGTLDYANDRSGSRRSNLTSAEQHTMMNLWAISHSPLMYGGNLPDNTASDDSLLTNADLIAVSKYGAGAHQVSNKEGQIVWSSVDPATGDRYAAMFNATSSGDEWFNTEGALYTTQTIAYTTSGLAEEVSFNIPSGSNEMALVASDGGDGYSYDHADIVNPRYLLSDGTELAVDAVTDSLYTNVSKAWNKTPFHINQNINGGTLKINGTSYAKGIACHASSLMVLRIPTLADGRKIVGFKALCGIDDTGAKQAGSTSSIKFYFFNFDPTPRTYGDASLAKAYSGLVSRTNHFDGLDLVADITGQSKLQLVVTDGGDNFNYDRANWVNPVLVDANGKETSLTALTADSYRSDWSTLHTNANVENGALNIGGKSYKTGLGMNGNCLAVYTLPADKHYVSFKAKVGLDYSVLKDAPSSKTNATVEFMVFGDSRLMSRVASISLPFTDLGIGKDQSYKVTDLWSKKTIGTYKNDEFATELAAHQSGLYRITPLDRKQCNSIAISSRKQTDGSYYIDVTLAGSSDASSYVQILCDGTPVGCISMNGLTTASYLAKNFSGSHNFQAIYSGTAGTNSCRSEVLSVDFGNIDGVRANVVTPANANTDIYSLNGTKIRSGVKTAEALHNLPKGIYVLSANKKKQMVR
jgi:hypothetical protein